jgi:sugar-specific transcriptional regulator TrmB
MLGPSPYESKAALALLKKHPANGYQVGKIAGIPISRVYDVLSGAGS